MTIPVNSGVTFQGSGSKIREILNYYPGSHDNLYITSSYRGYSTGSHHSSGNAVDVASPYPSNVGPMKDVAKWLMQFAGDLTELIHTNGNYFVKNGSKVGAYYYSSATRANHWNHVHVAMTSSQADRILAKLRKSGGSLGGTRSVLDQQKGHNYLRYLLGQSYRLKEDGDMGPKTTAGVKWVQGKIGVKADGAWGPATEAAYLKHVAALKGPEGAVRSVLDQQKGHNYLRYLLEQDYRIKEDRLWGPTTESAVKWVQKQVGVTQDGVWGKNTEHNYMKKVNSLKGKDDAPVEPEPAPKKENLTVNGVLDTETVAALQRALKVKDDGLLGPVTVKALQKKVGATQDGVLGTQTVRKLQEYLNRI
jgi:peptidoglycan hydrolase-like protein with peptidoglycan-binding domain